jgi:c-di-GMP-binding flagellar brake protein YcgR
METQKGWLERRQFERVRDVLKVFLYPINQPAAEVLNSDDYKDTTPEKLLKDKTKNPYIQSMTEDVSQGGMSILTEIQLNAGQLVIIDLYLPKILKPIKLLAEVRHVENVRGSTSNRAGVKILSVNKTDLKRIENYIFMLKMQKGG